MLNWRYTTPLIAAIEGFRELRTSLDQGNHFRFRASAFHASIEHIRAAVEVRHMFGNQQGFDFFLTAPSHKSKLEQLAFEWIEIGVGIGIGCGLGQWFGIDCLARFQRHEQAVWVWLEGAQGPFQLLVNCCLNRPIPRVHPIRLPSIRRRQERVKRTRLGPVETNLWELLKESWQWCLRFNRIVSNTMPKLPLTPAQSF